MKPILKNIAGIECLCIENINSQKATVVFHGYGANMKDLFPLWELWDDGKTNWYFPNGILSLPMGIYEGRAWFSIDMEALDRAIRTGEFRDLASNIPPEFDVTIKQQENFLREIAQRHKEITLCGFSQGAMCAFHLATKGSLPVVGLILLSAGLIAEERLPQVSRSIPFYQSHGTKDPILSLSGAKKLEEKLLKMNFQGKLEIFDGGHEIPLKVIEGVKKFLQKTLSDE